MEVRGLSCERGFNILFSDLDFSLREGELTRISGPNGSGKTTLLRTLAGIHQQRKGDIYWNGMSVAGSDSSFSSEISFVGHKSGLRPDLTPLENLEFFSGLATNKLSLTAPQSLVITGCTDFHNLPCHQLSAGQLQRVTLARLCLARTRLWLLDEPATSLDRDGIKLLGNLIHQHATAGGLVVYCSHQDLNSGAVDTHTIRLGLGLGQAHREPVR